MGGLVFMLGTVVGYFFGHLVARQPIRASGLLVMGMMLGMGGVGFIDDYLKVRHNNSDGLRPLYKMILSAAVAGIFALVSILYVDADGRRAASTAISGVRDLPLELLVLGGPVLGLILYVLWVLLIGTAVSNAVNLVDGLDGLAAGSSAFAVGAFGVIAFWQAQQSCFNPNLLPANQPGCYNTTAPADLAVIAACLVGALIGFLWWNTHPAQVIMGDSGAFGIGERWQRWRFWLVLSCCWW